MWAPIVEMDRSAIGVKIEFAPEMACTMTQNYSIRNLKGVTTQ